jgi:ribosome modulation factor
MKMPKRDRLARKTKRGATSIVHFGQHHKGNVYQQSTL